MIISEEHKAGFFCMFYKASILCVILLIYATVADAAVTQEQEIEESLPSDGVSIVVVKAVSGSVTVSSWERAEVLVKAHKRVKADSDEKAQEYADKIKVEVQRIEDRIEIETQQSLLPSLLSGADVSVDYDISVPEDINLDIENTDGSIYVTGNRGSEKISTIDGNIELKDIAGSVSARTIDGDIHVEALFDAESSFGTTNGSIDICIGDDFSVPISAHTISGDINITIPAGFSANIEASALTGQVSCDFPVDGTAKERSMRGSIFGGGPLLKLTAIDGKIAIRAAAGQVETAIEPESEQEEPQEEAQMEMEDVEEPSEELEVRYAEVAKTLDPPIIDGRLDDRCWRKADSIGSFVWSDGTEKPHDPTEAYLLWDERNFYIGVKCYESDIDAIRISNTEADKEAWQDDMVQMFIDATPETEEYYYHIAVNPVGAVFDQEIKTADAIKQRHQESRLGVRWNSDGLINTDIRDDSWTIEAGIPFSSLKAQPKEGDTWRFNLYRVEQYREEHTYWSPTFSRPGWPHVPDRFGQVAFISVQLVAVTPEEQLPPPEEALVIADISVRGNDKVSQDEILEVLKLKSGDLVDVELISQARRRLESLGWFQRVGIDLTENDKDIDLVVKVIEKDIILPSEVQIRGSALFTEKQIMKYFSFGTVRTTMGDVKAKCRLIEKLYKARGYEMVAVRCSVVSNALIIDIDEGYIDKIEVRGNKKVRIEDILEMLDLETGTPYRKDEIDKAVYTMKSQSRYFRKVSWETGRSDDGMNIVYIDVEETDLIEGDHSGIFKFDRVHGLQLGIGSELKSTYGMAKAYCKFSYGFSSEIWNYQLGMEKSWSRRHRSTIGIDVHRLTDTNDWEIVTDNEHFIAEAILGEAWRDFYQREGYELKYGQNFSLLNKLEFKYRSDEYTSLEKTNDWSVLDRSYDDDDWFDDFRWAGGREKYRIHDDEKHKPGNPPIKEGKMKSLIAEYTIDTRNSKSNPNSGWLNTFSAEYAGGKLGGEFDFERYQVNIRKYNRLSGNQFFTFRVKAATTDRALSEDHPRKLYLGGIGTLRGYHFKEFSGDKMVLLNAEYWIMTNWPPGLGIAFFADSGYAWSYNDDIDADDMKTNMGIGFQLGALRVNLASPVGEEEKSTVLSARLARMF